MLILIIAIASALIISFFCTLMESCLLSVTHADIARLNEKHVFASRVFKKFKLNIQRPIAAILIVNTVAHTLGAAIAGGYFYHLYGSVHLGIFAIILTFVMVQWTEILPRTIGIRFNRQIAVISSGPLSLLTWLLRPAVHFIELLNRPFEKKRLVPENSAASDISVLARAAAAEHQISREQQRLIERSMQLSKMKADDIMVSRSDMNTLSTAMTLTDALIAAHMHHHTRFPLADKGDIDQIVGYVNFKDIVGALRVNPADPTLRGIRRPIEYVNAEVSLSELLRKLTRGYRHIAIIQDSDKKTLGMITLEDIIETLVGDLEDEYDNPPDLIVQLSETRFRAGGGAQFSLLRKRISKDLPDWDLTLDDWIQGLCAGKVNENYTTSFMNSSFKVRRISRGRVYDVIIERLSTASLPEQAV